MSDGLPVTAPRRDLTVLAALFALAAVVRCIYVWSVSADPSVVYPLGDSLAYHAAALEILAGDWLGSEIFYQDPLYPYVLAILYSALGVGTTGVLFAQALLGSLSVLLVYLAARELFDRRSALIAGLFAAFYRVFWYYEALLLKVSLTFFLASLTAYLLVRADSRRTPASWLAAGMALGLASLTRGNYLVFAPLLLLWIGLAYGLEWRRKLAAMAAVTLGVLLCVGPVAARNYWVGSDFVLITSQAGQNFFIGNYRGNDTGVYRAPDFVVANAFHEQEDFREEAERRLGVALQPSELSRYWFRQALSEIGADPAHFFRHTARKASLFFNDYEVPDNQSFRFFQENVSWLLSIPTPGFGALLPLAVIGVYLARRRRSAWLMVLFFSSYAVSVIFFFNASRYRIPALPAVLVFSGWSVSEIVRLAGRRELRSLALVSVALALGLTLTHQELLEEDFALYRSNLGLAHARRAGVHHQSSRVHAREGDVRNSGLERAQAERLWDLAEAQFRQGLEVARHDPRLRHGLRRLLVDRIEAARERGGFEDALEVAIRMTATFSRDAEAFAIQGELYEELGDPPRAKLALSRALSLSRTNQRAKAALARIRSREGSVE
jgi:4-amino-4-deoxy-L-arabinose transferase-like glycosyltransferase